MILIRVSCFLFLNKIKLNSFTADINYNTIHPSRKPSFIVGAHKICPMVAGYIVELGPCFIFLQPPFNVYRQFAKNH